MPAMAPSRESCEICHRTPRVRSDRSAEMPAPRGLGDDSMFFYMAGYCLAIRLVFFYSLVRTQVKFDTMKDHWLFLGVLFTAATGFLTYVFILSWQRFTWANWQVQIARNFGDPPVAGLSGRGVPAFDALLLADGEVRRGRDLLDPAPAGSAARLLLLDARGRGRRDDAASRRRATPGHDEGWAGWASCSSARVAVRGSRSIRAWPARRGDAGSAASTRRSHGPKRSRR